MMLRNSKILVLGGFGLVGMAVCRKLLARGPKALVVLSLKQQESEAACKELAASYPHVQLIPVWGDIFVRESLKDIPRSEIMSNDRYRAEFIEDFWEKPSPERLRTFYLHRLISEHKPDLIVDSVNSATGLAYQDLYSAYYDMRNMLQSFDQGKVTATDLESQMSRFVGTVYMPQLLRHIQVLVDATMTAKTHTYVKVGTTGTGGMGFNIPYTHAEDKPSGQLLAKSAVAGAHSMLLFLMARTPGCPYVKEVKPAAAIAWKRIAYGEVMKGGRPIPLFDCPPDAAEALNQTFQRVTNGVGRPLGENLKSVFIDTGENGIFSTDEFFTITASEQMEFVTPEEIAQAVLWEIEGGNTGLDVIGALDSVSMGPSYRAGILRSAALDEMARLQRENGVTSIAFEMLGPPHLSKLLYEAHLIKLAYPNPSSVQRDTPEVVATKVWDVVCADAKLRATIISIGVPILLPDGKRILRAPEVKIPAYAGSNELRIEATSVDEWADKGWIDLRPSNMERWQRRIDDFFVAGHEDAARDTSSAFPWERRAQGDRDEHFAGRIVTHIFINEEKGERIKS
ncbi:short-chain dehydrogenase [candidate division KSB1 bacterium]|nr:short-chain dehydrogenase [candidate division KSB1 bacterium]